MLLLSLMIPSTKLYMSRYFGGTATILHYIFGGFFYADLSKVDSSHHNNIVSRIWPVVIMGCV